MLKALLKKQFLELNTFYFQNRKTGKNRSKGGTTGMIVLFVLLFIGIGFSFYGMGVLFADTFIALNLDWLYFAIMGLMALFLGVFGGVFNTYAGLYHAKDNELLLSMPIPPSQILFARMVGVYAMGLLYESLVFVPAIICYWVRKPLNVLNVLFPTLLVFILGFLVLSLICALGWVVALISSKLKNKSIITALISLIFLGAYYFFYFKFNTFLQNIVGNAQHIGDSIRKVYPVYIFGRAAVGEAVPMLATIIVIAVVFVLTYFILSKSFIKIVTTKQAEKKTVYNESKSIKTSSAGSALLKKEFKRFLGSPTYMLNTGLGIIILPVLSVAALIKMKDARELIAVGTNMFPELMGLLPIFAVCVICMMLSMNAITAPSISLEGKTIWILQSMPIDPWDILQAKQKMHLYLNAAPAVISATALGFVVGADTYIIVLMNAFALSFVLFSSSLGLFMNLLKPNLVWTNETVPIKQGMSIMVTLFGGWLIAILFGFIAYLTRDIIEPTYYLIGVVVILALASRFINGWLKNKGTKIFAEL